MWGISSAGRALAWHARGQRFDPAILHQKSTVLRREYGAFLFAEADFWGLHCFACTVFRFLQAVPIHPQHLTLHRFQTGKRFEPSIQKKRKILIPTWVYSCCVRHEENRSENCRIVFLQMGVSRMGYGYCNIIYGQIRQKSLIFFVYL